MYETASAEDCRRFWRTIKTAHKEQYPQQISGDRLGSFVFGSFASSQTDPPKLSHNILWTELRCVRYFFFLLSIRVRLPHHDSFVYFKYHIFIWIYAVQSHAARRRHNVSLCAHIYMMACGDALTTLVGGLLLFCICTWVVLGRLVVLPGIWVWFSWLLSTFGRFMNENIERKTSQMGRSGDGKLFVWTFFILLNYLKSFFFGKENESWAEK